MKAEYTYQHGDRKTTVTVAQTKDGFQVSVDRNRYVLTNVNTQVNEVSFTVDKRRVKATTVHNKDKVWVNLPGQQCVLSKQAEPDPQRRKTISVDTDQSGNVLATMPGQVIDVLTKTGDRVETGQPLVILEAMKMELRLSAPFTGIIQTVDCIVGQTVDRDELLVKLTKPEAAS